MISVVIENAQSIDEIVSAVNSGGTSSFNGDQLAGQYAYNAALDAGYCIDENTLICHLDFLSEAGAMFDSASALTEIKRIQIKV